ncbi:hypothetical protein L7F22_004799 [Adiantum nelumboides]|nr:hypothetical protein [Adiantum nelumboides]
MPLSHGRSPKITARATPPSLQSLCMLFPIVLLELERKIAKLWGTGTHEHTQLSISPCPLTSTFAAKQARSPSAEGRQHPLLKFYPSVYRKKQDVKEDNYCKYDNQVFQLYTSCLYMAALLATFIACSLTRKRGFRNTMLTAGIFFVVGTVLGVAAENLAMLMLGRPLLTATEIMFGSIKAHIPVTVLQHGAYTPLGGATSIATDVCSAATHLEQFKAPDLTIIEVFLATITVEYYAQADFFDGATPSLQALRADKDIAALSAAQYPTTESALTYIGGSFWQTTLVCNTIPPVLYPFDPGGAATPGVQDFEMGDAMKADGAFINQEVFVTPLIGKLRLRIQGYVDKENFFISPLKHEDVILGAPWFDRLATSIKFPEKKISFKFREKDMYTNAQESGSSRPLVNDQAFDKSIKSSVSAYMIFLKDSLNGVDETQVNENGMQVDLELSNFLNQFQDVFIDDIPGELPPKRGDDDHMIELIPGSSPPNKPPYRVS